MTRLVLLRHGESVWNLENRFTGWVDVDLSNNGRVEAKSAGKLLVKEGFGFDLAFTSLLKRSQKTLELCLGEMDLKNITIKKDWRLNERHYGSLQGLNKNDMVNKFGEKQVLIWRRSYDISPPKLKKTDSSHPINDPKYSNINRRDLPSTESLKDVINRFLPLWHKKIIKSIMQNKKVLIVAHGNSLRAIYKIINKVSHKKILEFNIPTGIPLVFEFDKNLDPIKDYYLGDKEEISKKIQMVKSQISKKG